MSKTFLRSCFCSCQSFLKQHSFHLAADRNQSHGPRLVSRLWSLFTFNLAFFGAHDKEGRTTLVSKGGEATAFNPQEVKTTIPKRDFCITKGQKCSREFLTHFLSS